MTPAMQAARDRVVEAARAWVRSWIRDAEDDVEDNTEEKLAISVADLFTLEAQEKEQADAENPSRD